MKVDKPEDIISISIFDVLGRQVETIGHSAVSNSMSLGASLKPGVYVVKVNGVNGVRSFKVIKK